MFPASVPGVHGGQVEIHKSQLKVTRTRRDKSLDRDLQDQMDRELEDSKARTAKLREPESAKPVRKELSAAQIQDILSNGRIEFGTGRP